MSGLNHKGHSHTYRGKLIAVVVVAVCAAVCWFTLVAPAKCRGLLGLVDYIGFWRVITRLLVKEVRLIWSWNSMSTGIVWKRPFRLIIKKQNN